MGHCSDGGSLEIWKELVDFYIGQGQNQTLDFISC